jgi:putative nucleotidyltransferase with HDIG domain
VTYYAVRIAQELNLSAERVERIRKGSLLHDIGKLGVPEHILFKPAPLTERESKIVRQHASFGAEIIADSPSLQDLIPIVRNHHERFDGRGYPDRLKGQDIALEARIVCLADALEAMASDRPYRKALSVEEIRHEIQTHAGSQFDPAVVNAFLNVLRREDEDLLVNSSKSIPAERFTSVRERLLIPIEAKTVEANPSNIWQE